MERIAVVGAGYVGLVAGACFADIGHDVTLVDSDPEKIRLLRSGRSPIYEAGLDDLILNNRPRLRFTDSLAEALSERQLVFLAVGTPSAPDGTADLSAVRAIARDLGRHWRVDDAVVVVKSTVPVGGNRLVAGLIRENLAGPLRFRMASCPEFLREGVAVRDVFQADRVVIGADDQETFERVAAVYRPLGGRILHVDVASAEMIKYAANAFLANRISFVNEIANLCEKFGADIDHVVKGVGSDRRIGEHFLRAGVGYGGSCFPKDTRALLRLADELDYDFALLRETIAVNARQARRFLDKILARYHEGAGLAGRSAAVWGLAFKPGTDDVRESPALAVVADLARRGARLRLYDPAAMDNFRAALPGIEAEYSVSAAAAAAGAELLVVLTEWEEFSGFPLARLAGLMGGRTIFDGRNCLSRAAAAAHGFAYISVGRPDVNG